MFPTMRSSLSLYKTPFTLRFVAQTLQSHRKQKRKLDYVCPISQSFMFYVPDTKAWYTHAHRSQNRWGKGEAKALGLGRRGVRLVR